jgi:hypothetical protein
MPAKSTDALHSSNLEKHPYGALCLLELLLPARCAVPILGRVASPHCHYPLWGASVRCGSKSALPPSYS